MGKLFSRFDPTPSRTPEDCERHYTQVHVHMAQELLRPMPSLLSYHTDRAVAQADVNGDFKQRPRAWRFAVRAHCAGRVAGLQSRAERDGRAGSRQLPVPPAFLRGRGDRAVGPPRRPDRAGQVHARGRPAVDGRSRAGLERLHRARGPGARGDGRRVRRPRAVPQPRALRDRVRARRRGGSAAGRSPRGDHARGLHRGVLRPSPLGRGGARRPRARRCAGPRSPTWWTSTSCGSKRRPRSRHVSRRSS